jgi:hypothetical protein
LLDPEALFLFLTSAMGGWGYEEACRMVDMKIGSQGEFDLYN